MGKRIPFSNTVRLEIIHPDPEALLIKLTDADIMLEDICFPDSLNIYVTVSNMNISRVMHIVDRYGGTCRILQKRGLLWRLKAALHRPVLLCGGLLFLLMALLLPGRILHVVVTGNDRIPTQSIIQCAEESGIHFGSAARTVRSEKIKNQILSKIPDLQWIGINTIGSVAIIQVEERSIAPDAVKNTGVASIVAVRDGVISDLIVHSGTALCVPGQSVLAGEVLISGYSDQGLKVTASVANGEIFAYTRREMQTVSPVPSAAQGKLTDKHTCYRLKIGKKVINFCDHSGISDATCDKMYTEYFWSLPGGFRLPVSVRKETCCYYVPQPVLVKEIFPSWLEADSEVYLTDHMVAGEILDVTRNTETKADSYRLTGIYFCHEMIGKLRYEEILDNHAENN